MAHSFDNASSQKIVVPDSAALDPASISIAFWFRAHGDTGEQSLLDKRMWGGAANGGYQMRIDGASYPLNFRCLVRNSSDTEYPVLASGAISANTWYHACMTFGSSTVTTYLNGVSQGTAGSASKSDSANDLIIGAWRLADNYFFDGDMAELALWNRVLTAAEVASLAKGFSPLFYRTGIGLYLPLVRDIKDPVGAAAITTYSSTASAHPPIFYPNDGLIFSKTSASIETATVAPLVVTATIPQVDALLDGCSNVLANGSFEDDTAGNTNIPAGWTAYNSGGAPDYKGVSEDWAYDGTKSFQVNALIVSDTGIKKQISGLTPGVSYVLSAYIKTSATVDNASLTLDTAQDSAGGATSDTTNVSGATEGRQYVNLTADSNKMNLFIGLGSFGSVSDGEAFFDAIMFEVGTTPTDYCPVSANVQNATVTPATLTLTPTTTTATFVFVQTATVAPVAVTLTPAAVTATSASVWAATAAPATSTLTLPGVTATSVAVYNAVAAPTTTTITLPAVTATYAGVYAASVAPVTSTLSATALTATYVFAQTASVAPITTQITLVAATATYASLRNAAVAPVTVTLAPTTTAANFVYVTSATVAPITTTLALTATTANYTYTPSATVAPLAVTLTQTTTTATFVYVNTATAAALALTLTQPAITATYSSGTVAGVTPVALTLAAAAVTANYVAPITATVAPLGITLTPASITATYAGIYAGVVAALPITLTLPSVTADSASSYAASVAALGLTITPAAVTSTYICNKTSSVSALALALSLNSVTATYENTPFASVNPLNLTITLPMVSATYIMAVIAGIAPLTLSINLPLITAVGHGNAWQEKNRIDWYAADPQTYHTKGSGDWYDLDPTPFNTKTATNWHKKY